MIKAILFDLDDTLIDFKGMKDAAITEASKAMVKAGLDMKASEAYEKLNNVYWEVGIESNSAIEEFLKRLGRLDDRILAAGINGYLRGKLANTDAVPGALEAIRKLKKKYKVGVITDAPRLKAWQRLNLMGMDKLFDVVVAYEDTGKRKPSEEPFRVALKKLKVKPEEAVMVGDWYERDVEGAQKVGMKAILVGKPCGEEDWCVSKFSNISKLDFD
jgi:putative hydrolase of the HAD superfamily